MVALLLTALLGPLGSDRADIGVPRLGKSDFGGWKVDGTAFGNGPVDSDVAVKLEIRGSRAGSTISSEQEGDKPQGHLTSPAFTLERNYISFLIAGGDYEGYTCMDLIVNGKTVKRATGRRSDDLQLQTWDVRPWHGQRATLKITDQASGDWGHINVESIVQTDRPERMPVSKWPLYQEPLRPQFHFTARQWTMDRLEPKEHQEGWINDLNGLIYYDGEWHLFAQRWATCWLHAVSKDLIHWTELEPAFYEESLESGVQSGTCVVDEQNTSGLGKDPKHPPMIAFWSRFDNRSQCLSYSLDKGRTWTRYPGNPTFNRPERDPKVFWYGPKKGGHWVMIMYGDGAYHILTSPDLLHWKDEHHPIPNSFECPDFFELPLDGDPNQKKWVLIQGNGVYSVGTFDGFEYKEEGERKTCDLGPNFYATQSWHDAPQGRRVQAAWMRGSFFPGMPFNQQVSFPCDLTLHSSPKGPRLYRNPIPEIASLHLSPTNWKDLRLSEGAAQTLAESGDLYHLKAEVEIPEGASLVISLRGESVVLLPNRFVSGAATGHLTDRIQSVEILLDRGSIETFVNAGELSSTRYALPSMEGLFLKATGGPILIKSLTLWPLKSCLNHSQ
ncbi:MAG: hypothetical protein BGO01_11165 [Armatimonadetes bacterium 55-13]|nr:glycoside hydrolase family 32 protein [Armatimonadota bacterium]OJU63179.1 MAG: hypothetical protein BGO01_11165 [Armatimonadetes bacterium 55-13]